MALKGDLVCLLLLTLDIAPDAEDDHADEKKDDKDHNGRWCSAIGVLGSAVHADVVGVRVLAECDLIVLEVESEVQVAQEKCAEAELIRISRLDGDKTVLLVPKLVEVSLWLHDYVHFVEANSQRLK